MIVELFFIIFQLFSFIEPAIIALVVVVNVEVGRENIGAVFWMLCNLNFSADEFVTAVGVVVAIVVAAAAAAAVGHLVEFSTALL